MSIIAHEPMTGQDDSLIVLTEDEWQEALDASLERLGITYEELCRQAETGDFRSSRARSLWVAIGGASARH